MELNHYRGLASIKLRPMKRFLVISALTAVMANPVRADDWLKRLMSDDIPVFEIAQSEARQSDPAAQLLRVSELMQFLKQASGDTRVERNRLRVACETLGLIGPPARSAVPELIKWLNRPGEGFATRDVMDALAKIGATAETAGIFIEQLGSPDDAIAMDAVQALGGLNSPAPEVVKALLQRLPMFKDSYQRMTAARALGAIQPWSDQDAQTLATYLNASDPSLQYAAGWLWQQVFPQRRLDRRRLYGAISHTMANASCRVGDHQFQLIIKSFSGDPTEDDYTIWIIDNRGPVFASFQGHLAMFSFLSAQVGKSSLCDMFAFSDDQGEIVIPMQRDDRPFGSQMAGLLYDPARHRILASEEGFGQIPSHPKIERLSNGFSFEEELQPGDSGACGEGSDGGCGQFHGQKIRSHTDEWIGVWWDIIHTPKTEGWQKRLNLHKTWEAASVRKYFTTPDEFAHAFGLDPIHNVVGTYWYRHLVLENGERWFCVAPAAEQTGDDTLCRRDGHV